MEDINITFLEECKKGNIDNAKALLDMNLISNIDIQNKNGNTALILACSNGNTQIVKLLKDHIKKNTKKITIDENNDNIIFKIPIEMQSKKISIEFY